MGGLLFLGSFPTVLRDLTPSAPDHYDFHALLFASDLLLFAVIAVALWRLPRERLTLLPALAAAFLVVLVAALLVHPSTRGAVLVFRWAGVVALATLLRDRLAAVALIGGWAVVEAVVALLQKIHGGPLGLPAVNEGNLSFPIFGHSIAPPGTLVHPYLLAGLALLGGTVLAGAARERRWLLGVAALAVAPVGFTYSRAALIGLAVALACFALARFPAAVLALAIGAAAPALVWSDGWRARAHTTVATSSTTGNGVDTARGALMRQAVDVVKDHPVAGVGPGRYVIALRERHTSTAVSGGVLKPVHNLPLLAAAEGGVVAGALMLALLIAAGVVAARAGPMSVAVFAGFAVFCLLDHFPYTFPQGLLMMGLWLGALSTARPTTARRSRRERAGTRP